MQYQPWIFSLKVSGMCGVPPFREQGADVRQLYATSVKPDHLNWALAGAPATIGWPWKTRTLSQPKWSTTVVAMSADGVSS